MKKIALLVALCMMTVVTGYAQEKSKVGIKVDELVKRYDKVKGVECVTVVKGAGLGMIKAALNSQFGKDFMSGVTSITIINYSNTSQETCLALRKEIDAFDSMLEEFKMGNEKESAEYEYARSFASVSEVDKSISDFVIAIESKDSKTLMYMAGKIKVE